MVVEVYGEKIVLPPLMYTDGKSLIKSDITPKFPPVVAQHMLHYATQEDSDVALYDPFVGKGVVPVVATLNYPRIREIYGVDADPDAVAATQLNFEQLQSTHACPKWSVTEGNALTSQLPKSQYPVVVVTDPPFGRASTWVDPSENPNTQHPIQLFLENMASQRPHRLIICFDEKQDISQMIRQNFKIETIEKFKDRRIYSMVNK